MAVRFWRGDGVFWRCWRFGEEKRFREENDVAVDVIEEAKCKFPRLKFDVCPAKACRETLDEGELQGKNASNSIASGR